MGMIRQQGNCSIKQINFSMSNLLPSEFHSIQKLDKIVRVATLHVTPFENWMLSL